MTVASSRTFSAGATYEVAFQALPAARLHLATIFHASGALWLRVAGLQLEPKYLKTDSE